MKKINFKKFDAKKFRKNKLNVKLFYETLFKILGKKYDTEIELTALDKKLPDGSVVEVYKKE